MTMRGFKPVDVMDSEEEISVVTIERLERRLTEESSAVQQSIAQTQLAIANLRGEMIDRSGDQLKWLLGFFIAQTAALAALLSLFR